MKGKPALAEAMFYYQWGEETEKAVPGQLLDTLKQLVALNTALIGGGMLGLRDDIMPAWCRLIVLGLFILSALAAIWGIVPRIHTHVPYCQPYAVRDHKRKLVQRRPRYFLGMYFR